MTPYRVGTQLLQAGVHPKVVSEHLGHASIGITLDTYSHVMPRLPRTDVGVIGVVAPVAALRTARP